MNQVQVQKNVSTIPVDWLNKNRPKFDVSHMTSSDFFQVFKSCLNKTKAKMGKNTAKMSINVMRLISRRHKRRSIGIGAIRAPQRSSERIQRRQRSGAMLGLCVVGRV